MVVTRDVNVRQEPDDWENTPYIHILFLSLPSLSSHHLSSPSRVPLRGSKGPTRDEGEEGRRFLGKESSPLEPIRELG